MENPETENQESVTTANVEVKQLSQKEAVKTYLLEALESHNVVRSEDQSLKELVTKDIRKVVKQKLFNGFRDGSIRLSKTKTDAQLNNYCSGLISNWLAKDKSIK